MSTDTTARPADALRTGDTPAEAPPSKAAKSIGGVAGWVDDRTGAAKPVGYLMKKVFPDHWSFMLGEIAMYSMIVCLLTGAFLTFWFVPSAGHTVYDGSSGSGCPGTADANRNTAPTAKVTRMGVPPKVRA